MHKYFTLISVIREKSADYPLLRCIYYQPPTQQQLSYQRCTLNIDEGHSNNYFIKLAPYGTDSRVFATNVSAKFKVT